ncbi:hypothetical protein GJAV_G00005950 [Gymnothorax javanicus]|nr:hypothetical protein GJAV_G00005950 [Gymnothorax javanicus]
MHSLKNKQNKPEALSDEQCEDFFPIDYTNKLSETQRSTCEGLISEEELQKAIFSFQSDKTPGLDGIPVEVYQIFYEEIKAPLLSCFNYSFKDGSLSDTQKIGLISLLLKQDPQGQYKDPAYLKNWRPLTLQCCDAKILAKCIAHRMKRLLPDIIHYDQTGFLHGRYIGENIRQLLEIMEYYDKTKKPGLVFIADFEKAFDKVRLDFIYKCLDFFNFGKSLIKVLYHEPCCKIINNGHFSDRIPLFRGLKQGCPLSPYLFIIAIEMLGIKVRANDSIKGLEINGVEFKVSMYADDTNFPINPQLSTLQNLVEDLNTFSKYSGLKPNYEKCSLLRIGSLKDTPFNLPGLFPIQWTDGPVNVLGIHIPKDMKGLVDTNFKLKCSKMDKRLLPWKGQHLTLYGKIALVNSLIVSQFTYLFMSLPSPSDSAFKLYEQKIFKFIWNNKPEKIKRKYLYNNYEHGGLRLLNLKALDLTLKASVIQKSIISQTGFLTDYFVHFITYLKASSFHFCN